jgi:solute carrier family 25 phosphate transporter 3
VIEAICKSLINGFLSSATGFRTIVAEQGAAGLFRGWVPTLLGYSAQGACKFGLYEYFKK